MYGFNRPKDSLQNVYMHPRFIRGNLNSMKLIKRKIGTNSISSVNGGHTNTNVNGNECGIDYVVNDDYD